jgi:hypothetical protein
MHSKEKNYKELAGLSKANDSRKSPIEEDEVSPYTRDQSNKDPKKLSMILPTELLIYSQV